jgi:hypothetical protein
VFVVSSGCLFGRRLGECSGLVSGTLDGHSLTWRSIWRRLRCGMVGSLGVMTSRFGSVRCVLLRVVVPSGGSEVVKRRRMMLLRMTY